MKGKNMSFLLFVVVFVCYSIFYRYNKQTNVNQNTQIIATIGQNLNIRNFCKNGANILRINGSHIKSDEHLKTMINNIKKDLKYEECKNVEIMYDTQGPEIRVLMLKNKKQNKPESYEISVNDILIAHTNIQTEIDNNANNTKNNNKIFHIGVNYSDFINDVSNDMIITIENRLVYGKIIDIDKNNGLVKILITQINTDNNKYNLTDRRHINLIGNPVSQPTLTDNDKKYIKLSALNGINYYAISFIRNKNDTYEVRKIIEDTFKEQNFSQEQIKEKMKNIKIIAKIENKQALDNLNEIIQNTEGSMVARGDLSSEIPVEEVPYAKLKIINISNKYKKFSILATDVLESLTRQEMVSRNDIDVVFTALQLNVSAIMLSNETAQGDKGEKAISILKHFIEYDKNKRLKKKA